MIHLQLFKDELEELVDFLTSQPWEFHGTVKVKAENIRKAYDKGYYSNDGVRTYWIMKDEEKVGYLRVYDLDDGHPLFDVRVDSNVRKKGIGKEAVTLMVKEIFTRFPEKYRIEGNTRADNIAMQKVFKACSFVKEAHYRQGWDCKNGDLYDAVGYSILRDDWENHTITPITWTEDDY